MKNTLNWWLNRRKFLTWLWALLSAEALWISTAVAQVLWSDISQNENARRDIILLLNGQLYEGTNTPTDKKTFENEIRKTQFTLEKISSRLKILSDANELNFFQVWESQRIYDYIIGQKSKLIQVNDASTSKEILSGEFEENIRQQLAQLLYEFANTQQWSAKSPLTSTDDKGGEHSFYGKPKDVPSVDNPKHFYGGFDGGNLPNTYINRYLYEKYVKSGSIAATFPTNNEIYIFTNKIEGRNFIAIYDSDGDLKVLSFVSIGTENHPTELPKSITKTTDEKWLLQMNKISIQANGSAMWGGVHIKWGVYFHSSALWIDGKPKSHGCIRTPLLYLHGLHEVIKEAPQGTKINMYFDNLY